MTTATRNFLAVGLIILGIILALIAFFAAYMAARAIDTMTEMLFPMSIGVGIALVGLFMVKRPRDEN